MLLLAGCTGGDSSKPAASTEAPTPTASGSTGSIAGLVVDAEERPVEGAEVGLLQTNRTARTDAGGRFTFNDVDPGRHQLAVSSLGHVAATQTVDVTAGLVADVRVILAKLTLPPEPVVRTVPFKGFLTCSYNPYYFVNPCGDLLGQNQDHVRFELDPALPFYELLLELEWTPATAATGQELELDLCLPPADATSKQTGCVWADVNNDYYEYVTGESPLRLNQTAEELPLKRGRVFEAWVGNGLFTPQPSVQQAFTLHVTTCYVTVCPSGTTALAPKP